MTADGPSRAAPPCLPFHLRNRPCPRLSRLRGIPIMVRHTPKFGRRMMMKKLLKTIDIFESSIRFPPFTLPQKNPRCIVFKENRSHQRQGICSGHRLDRSHVLVRLRLGTMGALDSHGGTPSSLDGLHGKIPSRNG